MIKKNKTGNGMYVLGIVVNEILDSEYVHSAVSEKW